MAKNPAPESPPADLLAEQSTLGAMMIEAAAIDKAAAVLTSADFSRMGHRTVFDALLEMRSRGEPTDFVTIQAELNRREALEAIGGVSYLAALLDTVPTAVNVGHYAEQVADKAVHRRAWEIAQRFAQAAGGHVKDIAALLDQVQSDIGCISPRRNAPSRATQRRRPIAERCVDLADVGPPGELPLLFGPYLLKGASHWLTGQTGLGKSTFAYNLCCALAEGVDLWGIGCEPQTVLYLDMESGDVVRASKVARLYRDAPRVRGRLIFLREQIRLPEELDELAAYVQAQGVTLVIFDTARRCFTVKDENDNAEVYNRIVPTLDALKQDGVATLTLGHPSKNGNGGARGAGAQEDAGDVNLTLTMHKGEVGDRDGVIALKVTKNRLLGHVPPLYLRRIGDDQFERVESEASTQGEPVSRRLECREIVLRRLTEAAGALLGFEALLQAVQAHGLSKTTLHSALKEMQEAEEITHRPRHGYSLADQPADNSVAYDDDL